MTKAAVLCGVICIMPLEITTRFIKNVCKNNLQGSKPYPMNVNNQYFVEMCAIVFPKGPVAIWLKL